MLRGWSYPVNGLIEHSLLLAIADVIQYAERSDETLKDADALIVVTEWKEFRNPDFDIIKKSLNAPVIFDGRNLYDLDKLNDMKFTYYSIGRTDIIN
jgi:UDPglucose 6-dehydrogenase